jgi:PAS domain S-box-containing protein
VTPVYDAHGAATHLIGVVHDITERERLEDVLRQREERLAFLLRLNDALRPLSDPMEMQDVTLRLLGEHLHVNRVSYSVIDRDDFIVTRSYDDGVTPFRGRWSIAAFGRALLEAYGRGETVSTGDVHLDSRFTDDERATLLAHGIAAFIRVMLRKEGRWVATFGVNSVTPRVWTQDEITLVEESAERMWSAAERAATEAALHERDERLGLALKASGAGSWTRDVSATHIDWDEGLRRLFGFTPDEPATYEAWLSRIHEEDRPKVLELVDDERRPTRTAWDVVYRIVRPDGTVAWIQSVGRIARDGTGEVTRLAGLELDITAQRQAEEARQARRDEAHTHELRSLLETAAQGIVSVDVEGGIVTANRAVEVMFGWGPGELIGQSIERLVPSSRRDEHVQHRANYVAAPHPRLMGGNTDVPALVGERRDGSTFPIEVSLNHIATPEGGRVLAFITDISARREGEAALRESHARLQERTAELEQRTNQLRQMASELTLTEQRAREQLAKTLHDGLQQLLAVTALHLEQQLNRDAERGLPVAPLVRVKQELDEAIAAARSLSVELSPPVLQGAGLPTALAWLADWTRRAYGLEVHVSADSFADSPRKDVRTLLFESVRELLFNVVKHAQVDEVTVDLSRDSDGNLRITVADRGVGFDAMDLTRRANTGQVGWGLFSIRERLTLLGGRLEIDSTPGRGTRFCLIAPSDTAPGDVVADAPSTLAPGEPASADGVADVSPARPLRMLIVDDHAAVRQALRELFQEQLEFRVAGEAANGLEAIAQARLLRPDVILMDVSMPEMGGVEATALIHAELPAIQIFGLSTQERIADLHAIELAGGVGYFFKGTNVTAMMDRLRQVRTP